MPLANAMPTVEIAPMSNKPARLLSATQPGNCTWCVCQRCKKRAIRMALGTMTGRM